MRARRGGTCREGGEEGGDIHAEDMARCKWSRWLSHQTQPRPYPIFRAERWEDGADIRVYDRIYAWATLARAQLKTARGGLGQSKYDGMQKVVAADMKLSSQTSHVLSCGGVSSRPLTAAALADVVQDPAAHFRGLLWWEPDARQLGLLAGKDGDSGHVVLKGHDG